MFFSLLGDVTARRDGGQRIPLGGRRRRAVLAVLLFQANKVVRRAEIIRLVWGGQPADTPATIDRLVSDYVSRLRTALQDAGAGVRLLARQPGYLIEVDEQAIDWHAFCRLTEHAQRAQDAAEPDEAIRLLRAALELWTGPALADLAPALEPIRTQMDERRLATIEALATLELARGRADRVLPLLTEQAALHPGREQLAALLIDALHATGRRDEAAAAYQRSRRHLSALGLDPAPAVEAAFRALLSGGRPQRVPPTPAGPAQLPLDTSNFIGRDRELARLLALRPPEPATPPVPATPTQPAPAERARAEPARAEPAPAEPAPAAAPASGVICVLDGMAGVGKTALAVHAAHRMARWFPDGQLFLDLHGYTANVARVEPAEALDRLLRAIGVIGEKIPPHLDDRAALYRDRLAGKRMLILLDNAHSTEQVRPLLPAAAGCLVLVTSRRRLTALDDAHALSLDTLPAGDAVALFSRVAGADRLGGQQEAVEQITDLCGGLPLAIRIVAARFRTHPAWQPRQLAQRLSAARNRPWELDDGERSVGAAFAVSYADLTAEHRRMFRLLGLVPGPDVDAYAAAALAQTSPERAARLLADLLDAHLLGQQIEDRYRFHDLMRSFAADLADTEDAGADRRAALTRLLDHHLRTAAAAMDVLFPHEHERRPHIPRAGRPIPPIAAPSGARLLLDAERANLIAAAGLAAEQGWPEHAARLDDTLFRYLVNGAHYADALELDGYALRAARDRADRAAEAAALDHTGQVHRYLGQYEPALAHLRRALEACREVGDPAEEARIRTNLAIVLGLRGAYGEALDQLQQALLLDRQVGNSANEANTLTNIGNLHLHADSYDEALHHYQQALRIYTSSGDRSGAGNALTNIGEIHERRGQYDLALDYQRQALRIFIDIGARADQAMALTNLGRTHARRGRPDFGRAHQQKALAIFRSIGHQRGQSEALCQLAALCRAAEQYPESLDYYRQALGIAREIEDRAQQATILNGLGNTLLASGRPAESADCYRQALALAQQLGNRFEEAGALAGSGELHYASGDPATAQRYWQNALDIFTRLGVPEAARVRERLHAAFPID